MGLYKFNNVGLKVVSACVPSTVIPTSSFSDIYTEDHIAKFIDTTGIVERRHVKPDQCASDLCVAAANNIFAKTSYKREDVDMMIFVTQTPDFRTPGSGVMIQDKLQLPKTTLVYDLNETCSGFIHGLLMAYSFLNIEGINNVLIMVGDTLSKLINRKDSSSGMLLGDSGMAAIVSKGDQFGESYFSMNADGSNIDAVITKGGGFRYMSSAETLEERKQPDGSFRSFEQSQMRGEDVFSFAISHLPKDVKALLAYADVDINNIDKYVFHQANKFMTSYICKKLKADMSKVLFSINKYGNTAGVSIPLTMVEHKEMFHPNESILMNAIGAGFVYGTALVNIGDCEILNMVEL